MKLQNSEKKTTLTEKENVKISLASQVDTFNNIVTFLQIKGYLKKDPTLGEIERAQQQFYRDDVDDSHAVPKARAKAKAGRNIGPIATISTTPEKQKVPVNPDADPETTYEPRGTRGRPRSVSRPPRRQ